MSKSQPRFLIWTNVSPDDILTAGSFETKFSILVCIFEVKVTMKTQIKHMTVSTIFSELLTLSQPKRVWKYIILSHSALCSSLRSPPRFKIWIFAWTISYTYLIIICPNLVWSSIVTGSSVSRATRLVCYLHGQGPNQPTSYPNLPNPSLRALVSVMQKDWFAIFTVKVPTNQPTSYQSLPNDWPERVYLQMKSGWSSSLQSTSSHTYSSCLGSMATQSWPW